MAAGCLPSIATIPIFIGLYNSLTNVAKEGLLDTEGFFWLPSLSGPSSLAARAAGAPWSSDSGIVSCGFTNLGVLSYLKCAHDAPHHHNTLSRVCHGDQASLSILTICITWCNGTLARGNWVPHAALGCNSSWTYT